MTNDTPEEDAKEVRHYEQVADIAMTIDEILAGTKEQVRAVIHDAEQQLKRLISQYLHERKE